jgi:hypothetical protein
LRCGQGYQGKEIPGQISALYPHIQPAVNQAGENLEAASGERQDSGHPALLEAVHAGLLIVKLL